MSRLLSRVGLVLLVGVLAAVHAGSASAAPQGSPPRTPDLSKVQVFLENDERIRLVVEELLADGEPFSAFTFGPDVYPTYALKTQPKAWNETRDGDDLLAFHVLFIPVRKGQDLVAVLTLAGGKSAWRFASLIEDTDLIQVLQDNPPGGAAFYDHQRGAWLSLHDASVEPIGATATSRFGSGWTIKDYASTAADYRIGGSTLGHINWLVVVLLSLGFVGGVWLINSIRAQGSD